MLHRVLGRCRVDHFAPLLLQAVYNYLANASVIFNEEKLHLMGFHKLELYIKRYFIKQLHVKVANPEATQSRAIKILRLFPAYSPRTMQQ